jgi:hypothetical protein
MNAVFFQVAPWGFDPSGGMNLKRTFRRVSFALGRLLANAGISGFTPLPDRIRRPVIDGSGERRWLEGLYFDTPEEWDDPYRFFRW